MKKLIGVFLFILIAVSVQGEGLTTGYLDIYNYKGEKTGWGVLTSSWPAITMMRDTWSLIDIQLLYAKLDYLSRWLQREIVSLKKEAGLTRREEKDEMHIRIMEAVYMLKWSLDAWSVTIAHSFFREPIDTSLKALHYYRTGMGSAIMMQYVMYVFEGSPLAEKFQESKSTSGVWNIYSRYRKLLETMGVVLEVPKEDEPYYKVDTLTFNERNFPFK